MGLIDQMAAQPASPPSQSDQPGRQPGAPAPCKCGCPLLWEPVYARELLCGACTPWPSRRLVARLWDVLTAEDGLYLWEVVDAASREVLGRVDVFGWPPPVADDDDRPGRTAHGLTVEEICRLFDRSDEPKGGLLRGPSV